MKVCKIKDISKNQFYNIIKKTLKNSVLVDFPKEYIVNIFFKHISDEKNFISLCALIKNKCVGILIVDLKKKSFSFKFQLITFYFAFKAFLFNKKKFILKKIFNVKFSKIKFIKKKNNEINHNYSEILYIGVDKNFRRNKIGYNLLNFFEKVIKKKINNIIVSSENSYEAIKFYKYNNFQIIGKQSRYRKLNILLKKKL